MNLAEQNEIAENFFNSCKELLLKKGTDYTPEDIAFKELDAISKEIGVDPIKVLWVYLRKHYTAIKRYVLHDKLESESIDTRLFDMANYCALFYVLVKRKENSNGIQEN